MCGGLSSCQYLSKRGVINIEITATGAVKMGRKVLPVDSLAEEIKKTGADITSSVVVDVPQKVTNEQLTTITAQLRKAGIMKVIFKKPPHIETISGNKSNSVEISK